MSSTNATAWQPPCAQYADRIDSLRQHRTRQAANLSQSSLDNVTLSSVFTPIPGMRPMLQFDGRDLHC